MVVRNFCKNLPDDPAILLMDIWDTIPVPLRPRTPTFVICESLFCGLARMWLQFGFPFNGTEEEETYLDWKDSEVWAWATARQDNKYFVFLGLEERLKNGRRAFCQNIEYSIYHELGHIYHWSKLGSLGKDRKPEEREELFANLYAAMMFCHYRKNGKFHGFFEKWTREASKFISSIKGGVDLSTRYGVAKAKKMLAALDHADDDSLKKALG